MNYQKLPSKQFYFSVPGETEQWYFEWLRDTVNNIPKATHKISLNCKIQTDPVKYAKGLSGILARTEVTHIVDFESEKEEHTVPFTTTLKRMREAEKIGKTIKYRLGYSNFTFDLWIVLHKADCNGPKAHRSHYVDPMNRAYNEKFENLDQYKHEANFKRILKKLELDNVKAAIGRSKSIMQKNEKNRKPCQEHGYSYYAENPSLTIWECVEEILKYCRLGTVK